MDLLRSMFPDEMIHECDNSFQMLVHPNINESHGLNVEIVLSGSTNTVDIDTMREGKKENITLVSRLDSRSSEAYSLQIMHLPPMLLYIKFPYNYPSSALPEVR